MIITKDLIAIAFEWAIPEMELNVMVVHAKTTVPLLKRIEGVDTIEKVREIINNFIDTGELNNYVQAGKIDLEE